MSTNERPSAGASALAFAGAFAIIGAVIVGVIWAITNGYLHLPAAKTTIQSAPTPHVTVPTPRVVAPAPAQAAPAVQEQQPELALPPPVPTAAPVFDSAAPVGVNPATHGQMIAPVEQPAVNPATQGGFSIGVRVTIKATGQRGTITYIDRSTGYLSVQIDGGQLGGYSRDELTTE